MKEYFQSHLKLGHQFNALLKVCSDRDYTVPKLSKLGVIHLKVMPINQLPGNIEIQHNMQL